MFFWNSLAFSVIQRMLAIWSLLPLPFLKPSWTSGTSQIKGCWSLAWRILSITLRACEMSAIVQFEHSLALPFFGIGMKSDLFQSFGHCRVFQICWHIKCSTFTASFFRIWNSCWIESHIFVSKICCFPDGTSVKNLPANARRCELQVPSLGWEDPLEGGMGTHSSILVWKIPWTEDPGGLQFMGLQRVRYN